MNPAAAGYAAATYLCLLLLAGCHSKSTIESHPDGLITSPVGIVFSIPNSEVTFFDLDNCDSVGAIDLGSWSVISGSINVQGSRLVVADDNSARIGVFSLPYFTEIASASIGGVPMDAQLNHSGSLVFIITNNSNFWIYSVGGNQFDTLETGVWPRRLTLRPPDDVQAWVACPGDLAVYVYDLGVFQPLDTMYFDLMPTAIAFRSDGAFAYVALAGDPGTIVIFDATTRGPIGYMEAGSGPFELAMSFDGTKLAASDSTLGQVRIWDLARTEQWDLNVGGSPGRIRYSVNQNAFYVTSRQQSRVHRIDVTGGVPTISHSLTVPPTVRELVLWEAPH